MSAGAITAPLPTILGRLSLSFLRRGKADGAQTPSGNSGGRRKRRFQLGKARWIALLLLALFMLVRYWDPDLLQVARLKVFDFYEQIKPRELLANSPVVIVDLDEASLASVGQWPWPRNIVAQLVANLVNMGVAAVGFDVIFAEPDRLNGQNVVSSLVGLDDETKAKLEALPSNDAIFGDVIRQAKRVVVGQSVLNIPKDYPDRKPLPTRVIPRTKKGAPPAQIWAPSAPGLLRNVPDIEASAAGHGLVSLEPEPDGIVRRVPSFFRVGQSLYPALSVELMRVATGRTSVTATGGDAGLEEIAIAPNLKPSTDRNGVMWPYFSRSDKDKYISAKDVLSGVVDQSKIKGKIAIVGTSAVGLLDIKTIPTERFVPGVEVHAQLIESVFTNSFLTRPPFSDIAEMAIAAVGGLIMIVLVPWVGAKWTLGLFVVMAGSALGASWYLFDQHHVLVDALYGVVAILIIYMTLTYTSYASEEKQRRQTRDAFSKYMSPAMVAKVVEDPSLLTLGGKKKDMSILFCDVRGFTSISELFDAEGLTVLINKLLTPLTNVILANRGTVDKYMGDAIMAFWNAPLDVPKHAEDAARSALGMIAEMAPLNERLAAEAAEAGRKHIPLKVGLGINSGEAVVGNMGTAQRMDYSVLGDTVNTASRLEGQSKTYGVDVVIGPNTEALLPQFATIPLDIIQVKGKTVGLKIYALMGDEKMAQDPAFQKMKETVIAMMAAYKSKDWDKTEAIIAELKHIGEPWHLDYLLKLYEGRIEAYRIDPPPENWDGVFVATSK